MNNTNRRFVLAGIASFSLLATACGSADKSTTTDAPVSTVAVGGDTTVVADTTVTADTTMAPANLEA